MSDGLAGLLAAEGLPAGYRDTAERLAQPLAGQLAALHGKLGRTAVVGLCGSQGSGKSTLALTLALLLREVGVSAAVLSLDDFYRTRAERVRLAAEVHPLFLTRGPPGTHDVAFGLQLLDALATDGPPLALPRFDKARDDRTPPEAWPRVGRPVDVVILEGWLVGARPEPEARLAEPVNTLEREEDGDGRWRRAANAALAGDYQALFAWLDRLVLLQAPGFHAVGRWRGLQEQKLAARLVAEGRGAATLDAAALHRFIAHYERLTRWMLEDMPARADVLARLDDDQAVTAVTGL